MNRFNTIELSDDQLEFIVYLAALFLGENDDGNKTDPKTKPLITVANNLINDIEGQTGITIEKVLETFSPPRKNDVNQN